MTSRTVSALTRGSPSAATDLIYELQTETAHTTLLEPSIMLIAIKYPNVVIIATHLQNDWRQHINGQLLL
jgi:hypothetical protein